VSSPTTGGGGGAGGEDVGGPVIRDRRRLDPQTGQVRPTSAATPGSNSVTTDRPESPAAAERPEDQASDAEAAAPSEPGVSKPGVSEPGFSEPGPSGDELSGEGLADAAAQLAAERLADLQRLHAEYVNYRRRVERDRDVARDQAIASVLEALLPVLDDVELARQHGDLAGGPFAAIAEKLEAVLGRFELTRYGATGEVFDPMVHEALMQSLSDEVEAPTVTTVLQPGYLLKEKVLRAARVGVTSPE